MVMKFVKKDLNDYIHKLSQHRTSEINQTFEKFVKDKFKEVIEPISKTLPKGDKIMKVTKQLSKAIEEFEKEMTAKKPELPAVYKFSEPVCKLTDTCEG